MSSLNVLVLDGNTRQCLPICKALKKNGHSITLLCVSKLDIGYYSKWPDKKIIGPNPVNNSEKYCDFLINIMKHIEYDIVLPLFDYSAEAVSKNKKRLEKYSFIAVNDWDVFRLAREKKITMSICSLNDIPHPKTLDAKNITGEGLKKIELPLILKPNVGDSAKGIKIINNYSEFFSIYDEYVEKYGEMLVQEYIPQTDKQYKAELYIDKGGRLVRAILFEKVRWYPIKGGSSTYNVTVYSDRIISRCYELLKAIGWKGYADIDLIVDPRDREVKVMEINPRITGSVKIAFKAGVDFISVLVDDVKGNKIDVDLKYKDNVYLRFLYKDLLWLFYSDVCFVDKVKWFNFRNNVDQIIDFSDPLPAIIYLMYSVLYFKR